MPLPDIHKNDVGTELVIKFVDEEGEIIDISTATTKQILLRKPGSATVTKTGEFDTDGTDGLLKYVTTKVGSVYDLDRAGQWQIQGFAVIGTNEWHTKINHFEVAGNLN